MVEEKRLSEKMRENNELKKIKEILQQHEKRIRSLEDIFTRLKSKEITPLEGKVGIEKLAKKIGAETEKIRELFDIENNTLTLLKVVGKDDRERTQKIIGSTFRIQVFFR